MWAWWRLLRSLLEQRWTAWVAGTLSTALLVAAAVGYVHHWPKYPTFLLWGIVWGVTALGSWAINR